LNPEILARRASNSKDEVTSVDKCRNCGSRDLRELGFIGAVAPFFLKRALNLEVKTAMARNPLRLLARRLCVLPKRFLDRVYGTSVFVEMQICLSCSFVQVKHPFSDEALLRLYADYRSSAYNEERIRYEPSYAAICSYVGIGDKEIESRVGGLTAWLEGKIECGKRFSMLDFGGSDGRFLPKLDGNKYVFEISDVSPQPGIIRINNEADLETYSYVQIAHVLEHVSEPLDLLKRASRFVAPAGYLYIEVPQELTDAQLAELKSGPVQIGLGVHEHINVYCKSAVTRLVEAAALEPISIETVPIDLGWVKGTVIRALCRKRP
jgi:Methyltransferase domain